MRMHPVAVLGLAIAAAVGCETRDDATVAGIGGVTSRTDSSALTISPSSVTIAVGTTAQLSTNAGSSQALSWVSSNANVASVSSTGLVSGFAPGATTITARVVGDTTQVATASVSVTSP